MQVFYVKNMAETSIFVGDAYPIEHGKFKIFVPTALKIQHDGNEPVFFKPCPFHSGEVMRRGGHAVIVGYKQKFCTQKPLLSVLKIFPEKYGKMAQKEISTMKAIKKKDIFDVVLKPLGSGYKFGCSMIMYKQCWGDFVHLAQSSLPPCRFKMICNYLYRAAQGLRKLHECGIVHGDVKPDNILIEATTGRVYFCDLSFAVVHGCFKGTKGGTPLYMSPDRTQNSGYGSRNDDIYAMGITALTVIFAKTPKIKKNILWRDNVFYLSKKLNKKYFEETFNPHSPSINGLARMAEALIEAKTKIGPIGFAADHFEEWFDESVLLAQGRADKNGVNVVTFNAHGMK